jgi:hypothetical protein
MPDHTGIGGFVVEVAHDPTGAEGLDLDPGVLDADQAAVNGAFHAAGQLPELLHGAAIQGRERGHQLEPLEQHPRAGHRDPELGHIDQQVDQGRPTLNNAVEALTGDSIMRPSTIWASHAALSRRASPRQVRRLRPPHSPSRLYRPGECGGSSSPSTATLPSRIALTGHLAGGMAPSRHRRSVGEADLLCPTRLAQGRHPGRTTSSPS